MEENTIVIGITGGIGTGKTSVAKIIEAEGYPVILTDDQAKLLYLDPEIKSKIIQAFGNEIYDVRGNFQSKVLSKKVFGNTNEHHKALIKLNQITHPPVIEYIINEIDEHEKKGTPLVFVESALIYEAELDEGFDYVIVVYTDNDIAIERTMKRTGLAKEDVLLRMKEQISNDEKKSLADFVIENNHTIEDLKNSTLFFLNIIKNLKKREFEDDEDDEE